MNQQEYFDLIQKIILQVDLLQSLKEEDIHKLVSISDLLQSFKEGDVQKLMAFSKIKEYSAGDLILEEGSKGSRIYYLLEGKVKVVKNNIELSIFDEIGNIFGEMAGIDGSVRSASVYAVEDTMCLEIDLADIDSFLATNQLEFKYKIYRQFARVLAGRLRVTTAELIKTKEEVAVLKKELDTYRSR